MQNRSLVALLMACAGCAQPAATANVVVVRQPAPTAAAPRQAADVDAPVQPDVRAALGATPPELCAGPAIDLAEAERRCRCVLTYKPSGGMIRAGLTCGEALTSRDLSAWISLSVVPGKLQVESGKELWIALRFTNRARVPMPLVYRLDHAAMLHDQPYLIFDAQGENASTGGTCGFGTNASDVQSVVVLEAGGTATLQLRVPASREIFVRRADPERWGCDSVGVEPLAPGTYFLEVFLRAPGLLAQRPRLMFEVIAPPVAFEPGLLDSRHSCLLL